MKNPVAMFLILGVLVAGAWLLPIVPVGAQNNFNGDDQMLPLAQTISERQKLIAGNQIQIEKSIAAIQEDLRQAKIYVSRSGKAGVKK